MLRWLRNSLCNRRAVTLAFALAGLGWSAWMGWVRLTRTSEARLLHQALRLVELGDRVGAAVLFDEVLRRRPDHGRALLARGQLARESGDATTAQQYWGRIPDQTPGIGGQARFLEGLLFLETGRAREAEGALLKAAALNPGAVEPHERLLKLYAIQLRATDIRRELHAIRKFRSWDLTELYQRVNATGEAVHRAEAIPRLEQLTATDRDDLHSLAALGRYYLWDDRAADAAAAMRRAQAQHPRHATIRALLAEALLQQSDLAGAREALCGTPPNRESPQCLWESWGLCLAAGEDWPGAAACLRRAVAMHPWDRPTVLHLAQALEHAGADEEARQFFQRAESLVQLKSAMFRFVQAPDNRPDVALAALFQSGQILLQLGRAEEALPFFEQVLVWDSAWPEARENYEAALQQERLATPDRDTAVGGTDFEAARAATVALLAGPIDSRAAAFDAATPPSIRFADRRREAGLEFQYFNGAHGRKFLLETTGGGVAVLDYDADGWPDLFFPQGGPIPFEPHNTSYPDRLYHHLANGTFADVTAAAGLVDTQYSQGCAAGDYDNDGFADLALANCGTNVLYHNNGDGTFTNVTPRSGIRGNHWSTSLGWGDLDRDGNLDLYVVNYVLDHLRPCRNPSGAYSLCHPQIFEAEPDALYVSRGDGAFEERLQQAGMAAPHGRGLGLLIADFNDDGWPEVYVANDASPCFLFQNLGPVSGAGAGPRFAEIGFPSGTAVNAAGNATAAMGVACADLDGDGRLDLYVANFHDEADLLYVNRGELLFEEAAQRAGLAQATRPALGWGAQALDADLDGRPEIFLTNGHLDDRRADGLPWKMPSQLFYNLGAGHFREISRASGEFFHGEFLGRGVARLDWDCDGRPDLVVVHHDRPAALLRNETEPTGNCLVVDLHGVQSNRDAIGARLRVTAAGRTQIVALCGGDGYCATNERRQVIGIGAADGVSTLEVTWPGGQSDRWTNLPANTTITLIEGRPPILRPICGK